MNNSPPLPQPNTIPLKRIPLRRIILRKLQIFSAWWRHQNMRTSMVASRDHRNISELFTSTPEQWKELEDLKHLDIGMKKDCVYIRREYSKLSKDQKHKLYLPHLQWGVQDKKPPSKQGRTDYFNLSSTCANQLIRQPNGQNGSHIFKIYNQNFHTTLLSPSLHTSSSFLVSTINQIQQLPTSIFTKNSHIHTYCVELCSHYSFY